MISVLYRPALVLIDIQDGFDDIEHWGGHRNNPDAERHAAERIRHRLHDERAIGKT